MRVLARYTAVAIVCLVIGVGVGVSIQSGDTEPAARVAAPPPAAT